jgi:hypothetical protein
MLFPNDWFADLMCILRRNTFCLALPAQASSAPASASASGAGTEKKSKRRRASMEGHVTASCLFCSGLFLESLVCP